MDQIKIGCFLQNLRKEKGMTQVQLAEIIGTSSRSVSRWETGSNMPDLDVLMQLADFYQVEISELLDGEKRETDMQIPLNETLSKVVDYNSDEKQKSNGKMFNVLGVGIITLTLFIIMELTNFENTIFKATIKGALLGASYGAMLWSAFRTHETLTKISHLREAKARK